MAQDVNLTSREWCELIFEGKNKQYGAYSIRQSSDKRHVSAILAIFAFVGAVITLPRLLESVGADKIIGTGYTDVTIITEIDGTKPKPKELLIPIQEMPKTPAFEQVRTSFQYVPPKLVSLTDLINESNLPTMENVLAAPGIIHIATAIGSIREGRLVDPGTPIPIGEPGEPGSSGTLPICEQMPQFPDLMQYLSKNLKYPAPSIENGVEGKVTVRFVVGKTGEVSDVTVLQSLDPFCDREAVRLISTMPKWIPGRQNGHLVSVYYTIPIRFRLARQ